jgi:phage gp46-like protein
MLPRSAQHDAFHTLTTFPKLYPGHNWVSDCRHFVAMGSTMWELVRQRHDRIMSITAKSI